MRRTLVFLVVPFLAGFFVSPPPVLGLDPASPTYFPLEVGSRWTYVESESGRVLEAEVLGRDGETVDYSVDGVNIRLRDGGADIDIELSGDGFVPYYRFGADDWTHRDHRSCDDGRMMRVLDRGAMITTPAGRFGGCLDIAYETEGCIDAGTFREWWAPGVGRVKWAEVTAGGMETWELQSFQSDGTETDVTYFPLATGNRWTYAHEDPWFGEPFEWTVSDRQGDVAVLQRPGQGGSHGGPVVLQDRGAEVYGELGREGFTLFYRFVPGAIWTRRDTFECDDGELARAVIEKEPIVTPAGEFHDCLRIERLTNSGTCSDAGTMFEWWAPGVGLVQWDELNFFAGGTIRIFLAEYDVGEPQAEFVRGDGNQDGSVNVSDPVAVLNFLFAGAKLPDCDDAADVNDDGAVNVADPVYQLNHLFAGGPAPAPPTGDCGVDPTADDLGCSEPPPCEREPE